MEFSRGHRIKSIFKRLTGLIDGNMVPRADRPVWYDVYARFPPRLEPEYDRPVPDMEIKPIFYEEDTLRARFHKTSKHLPSFNLSDDNFESETKSFIKNCRKVAEEKQVTVDEALEIILQNAAKSKTQNPSAENE